jgi:hypothetical protein
VWAGGIDSGGTRSNVIDYVTIASAGNATDFGDLTLARDSISGCSSTTRGVFGGGNTPTKQNVIDYVTIASTGNATDFGDLTLARGFTASYSSNTRGVWAGGENAANAAVNVIDYITIASTGNATDFGDLAIATYGAGGCSNATRGLSGGGVASGADVRRGALGGDRGVRQAATIRGSALPPSAASSSLTCARTERQENGNH